MRLQHGVCFGALLSVFAFFVRFCLGVARGLLQERPLQFQHGNIHVKSWPTHVQLLVNF